MKAVCGRSLISGRSCRWTPAGGAALFGRRALATALSAVLFPRRLARVQLRTITECQLRANKTLVSSFVSYSTQHPNRINTTSDVVLVARPWPRGASRPNFMALALALASKVQALALALASKVQALALALASKVQALALALALRVEALALRFWP